MGMTFSENGTFQIKKGDIIFKEGQSCSSINILISGSVGVYLSEFKDDIYDYEADEILKNSYKLFGLTKNTFLGVEGLFFDNEYALTYVALEDCSIYVFNINDKSDVNKLLKAKPEYAVFLTHSISMSIISIYGVGYSFNSFISEIEKISDNIGMFFFHLKSEMNFSRNPRASSFLLYSENYDEIKGKVNFPSSFSPGFIDMDNSSHISKDYDKTLDISPKDIDYYKRILSMNFDIRKSFFGSDATISVHFAKTAATIFLNLLSSLKGIFSDAKIIINTSYSTYDNSLFDEYLKASVEVKSSAKDNSELASVLKYLSEKIKSIHSTYSTKYDRIFDIDLEALDSKIKDAEEGSLDVGNDNIEIDGFENLPQELSGSLEKIIDYAGLSKEKSDVLLRGMDEFRASTNRLECERTIKNSVTPLFFELYESVFTHMFDNNDNNRLMKMFINFGFLDDKVLDNKRIITLYKLNDATEYSEDKYQFHNSYEWLTQIYEKNAAPSVNDFGQDYLTVFRDLKKRGVVSDADKEEYEASSTKRINHEVSNLFKTNQRLTYGQISTYFPVLHDDMILKDLSDGFVTKSKMEKALDDIINIDYSAFHREILHIDPDNGIQKEFVMRSIFPEIIILPTFGSRAVMWQELTGTNKLTRGRILLPAFTSESMSQLLIKAVGDFRWELCKTLLGPAWNDVSQTSLTADYADYIQFYKKNRDLSDEVKEKIKIQMQKYRNNLRDIFTHDYTLWINYESKGIMRLNKTARSMLYRHCPFNRKIRENLSKQPMFSAIDYKFNNIRSKKAKEVENRYHKYIRDLGELPAILTENIAFYKDL